MRNPKKPPYDPAARRRRYLADADRARAYRRAQYAANGEHERERERRRYQTDAVHRERKIAAVKSRRKLLNKRVPKNK